MTSFADHHLLSLMSISNAALDIVDAAPKTDLMIELREILEANFEILDCLIHHRHYGSDNLDVVITHCNTLTEQIKILEQ